MGVTEVISSLAGKFQKDTFIKNAEGIHSLYDLFYVVKIICRMKNWSKVKSTGGAASAGDADMNAEIEQAAAAAAAAAQPSTSSSGRGKKKVNPLNRGIPILEQTIAILPALYKNVQKMDKSLTPIMDEFLKELCKSFSTFVQFVQPPQFWDKYRVKAKRKPRRTQAEESSDEDEEDEDGAGGSDGEGTVTTMESCLQNNLSDEDFDDL